jgi:hypothetical protein
MWAARAARAQGLSRPSSKPLLDCAANTLCEWGVGNYTPAAKSEFLCRVQALVPQAPSFNVAIRVGPFGKAIVLPDQVQCYRRKLRQNCTPIKGQCSTPIDNIDMVNAAYYALVFGHSVECTTPFGIWEAPSATPSTTRPVNKDSGPISGQIHPFPVYKIKINHCCVLYSNDHRSSKIIYLFDPLYY